MTQWSDTIEPTVVATNDRRTDPTEADMITSDHGAGASPTPPVVDFCGEVTQVDRDPFTIGRDADVVIDDDNRFLHRRFLTVSESQGVWLLSNVGSQLTATVSGQDGRLEAFLSPGAVLPLVFAETLVRFTAGPRRTSSPSCCPTRPSRRARSTRTTRATPRSGERS